MQSPIEITFWQFHITIEIHNSCFIGKTHVISSGPWRLKFALWLSGGQQCQQFSEALALVSTCFNGQITEGEWSHGGLKRSHGYDLDMSPIWVTPPYSSSLARLEIGWNESLPVCPMWDTATSDVIGVLTLEEDLIISYSYPHLSTISPS